jgi:hypothetical protein
MRQHVEFRVAIDYDRRERSGTSGMLKLKWPSIPSPSWFRDPAAGHHVGIVGNDRTVVAYGDAMTVLEGSLPAAGTRIVIVPHGTYLSAQSEIELRAHQEARAKEAAERERASQDALKLSQHEFLLRRQELAESDNAKLLIPVRWTSGRKTVLSGLSRNGSGDGQNARTVVHALLLDPIDEGRFKRAANGFLCTSGSGSNGEAWTGKLETTDDGVNGCHVSRVTCRSCLELAARWTDPRNAVAPEIIGDTPTAAMSP